MKQFLIWNPEKVSKYLNIPEEEQNALAILKREYLQKTNCSSYIEAIDEEHASRIVNSFNNEFDLDISFAKIPKEISLFIFDNSKYTTFFEAKDNDAIYEVVEFLNFSTLLDKNTISLLMQSINKSSECCAGENVLEAVVIDNENPEDVYLSLNDYFLEL